LSARQSLLVPAPPLHSGANRVPKARKSNLRRFTDRELSALPGRQMSRDRRHQGARERTRSRWGGGGRKRAPGVAPPPRKKPNCWEKLIARQFPHRSSGTGARGPPMIARVIRLVPARVGILARPVVSKALRSEHIGLLPKAFRRPCARALARIALTPPDASAGVAGQPAGAICRLAARRHARAHNSLR
jgi:hypothetical protein